MRNRRGKKKEEKKKKVIPPTLSGFVQLFSNLFPFCMFYLSHYFSLALLPLIDEDNIYLNIGEGPTYLVSKFCTYDFVLGILIK